MARKRFSEEDNWVSFPITETPKSKQNTLNSREITVINITDVLTLNN